MNTSIVKLKETAVSAFIVINAMKYILEENGFELVHEKVSLHLDNKKCQDGEKNYCLSYLVDRTINNLEPIMEEQEYALIPCEQSEEVLNAHKILGDLFSSKNTEITLSTGESYSLLEQDVWTFNRNFNNYWVRE
ncbi:hypothetical protein LF296_03195 [Acinetobacter vivianii]|uniref:Uncharacterized protein n=1 Tax=Acinetobacter vivianii TaxID=1776742 RepID=A0AAJ6NJZ0_9GAMM|nr:hypothetical protein [Acinetobacter vivianii]WDZ51817.1 hypothetical protein LF296_03195 [Acinetobacter vivianii]